MDFETELARTKPDYVVYKPASADGSTHDTGNEHFLVFDGPDGSLMAVWTQSTVEGCDDQRIVFVRSDDEGITWTAPKTIAGGSIPGHGKMASWGFPMVSKSGRIYVLYNKHIGVNDIFEHTTGLMAGVCSDDNGETWSPEGLTSMPRGKWDNADPKYPANWIVWQKPARVSEGKYLVGFTRWVSPTVAYPKPINSWIAMAAVVEFMRFENLDDNPAPEDLAITWIAANDDALQVSYPGHPALSVVQEPSIVPLPDGRLFVALRTSAGHPYYAISSDAGLTWSKPEPIRETDDGEALLHPLSPCPIFSPAEGRYILFLHDHDGHFGEWRPEDTMMNRRPVIAHIGKFMSGARQPIWFERSEFFADNDGVAIGSGAGRADFALYSSFTVRDNKAILWFPDRKFFLVGKQIPAEWYL